VIKNTIDIHDFKDILDNVSVYEKDIDTVVISMPGIVKNGRHCPTCTSGNIRWKQR